MNMSADSMPTVLMVMICLRCALGGAEKRYARVFEMFVAHNGCDHRLLINRSVLALLQAAGILTHHDAYLIILDPPSSRRKWLAAMRYVAYFVDSCWYVWQCWLAIGAIHPQIVHPLLTGIYLSLPGLLLHPQTRLVMSAYSYPFESSRDRHLFGIGLGATTKRFAMRLSKRIDALSATIRDDLVRRGIEAQKIQIAPGSFTDLTLCQPAPIKRKEVVFAARFVDVKNPLLFAHAIPILLRHHPDAHVWFLGNGPLETQIRQELNVAQHVTIRFEPQPTRVLNHSSIFVSLQSQENYPSQSLLEAMACANAIVATDVGETWRLVDETNGMRVLPSAEAVAAAIVALLDNPELPRLQQASRQRVLAHHTAERFYEYINSVYNNALGNTFGNKLDNVPKRD
jgi:glycosyltransferase involved in cell wall biosynthesis